MFTTLDGSLMKKAFFFDDVILIHTYLVPLAAGDLSELRVGLGILGEHYFEHNTLVYGASIMLDYASIIDTF